MEQFEQVLKEGLKRVEKPGFLRLCWNVLFVLTSLLAILKLGEACGEFNRRSSR